MSQKGMGSVVNCCPGHAMDCLLSVSLQMLFAEHFWLGVLISSRSASVLSAGGVSAVQCCPLYYM